MNNLNSGIDAQSIFYFTEQQFEIVLQKVKALKAIGLYGIEVWKDGEFWEVSTFESYNSCPQNPDWYEVAVPSFLTKNFPQLFLDMGLN